MKRIPSIHPGEILLEEFCKGFSLSQYRLAKEIHVPARRINEIVHGKRSITTDTAMRLAAFFNTSPFFWIHLQAKYDITQSEKNIENIIPLSIA